jgi:hypothetical protein
MSACTSVPGDRFPDQKNQALLSRAYGNRLRCTLIAANCGRHTRTRRHVASLIEHNFLESRQEQQNIRILGRLAHQANPPDFALGLADATGDLEVEFVQKLLSDFPVFKPAGNLYGSHGYQPVGGIRNK